MTIKEQESNIKKYVDEINEFIECDRHEMVYNGYTKDKTFMVHVMVTNGGVMFAEEKDYNLLINMLKFYKLGMESEREGYLIGSV